MILSTSRLRSLDAALFFLKSVDHHQVRADLDGIDCALGIAPIFESDLEHAAIYFFERFGDIGLATLRRDRQRPPAWWPGHPPGISQIPWRAAYAKQKIPQPMSRRGHL
ncbi:hypothetical protein, partial [Bradyrhizobium sp.]|uniref:hypothetical protein n=1 Tax=Bradyrhizobium sp. TaxID=376 RepID=UPI003C1861EF